MKYSVIIPVFNRPDEVEELLESLTTQTVGDFEVVVVEDGSQTPCREVVDRYIDRLDIAYYMKPNGGPGPARNYGAERAKGDYLIILDSDCVLPPTYFEAIDRELAERPCDAFGGPDRAHDSFTPVQKAISYSMTSFFTTGGIRGGKKKLDKFYPRSFNMGIRRDVYAALGGFSPMRFGEDIDLSIRIFKGGYSCRLMPDAWVWHKRRTDMDKFFKQVFNSGIARINLQLRHPGSMKLVHTLPALFTVGMTLLVVAALVLRIMGSWLWWPAILPVLLFCLLVFTDSAIKNHSIFIGLLSVEAAFVQLYGYGLGFIGAWWQRMVMHRGEYSAYEKTFYD